MRVRPTAGDPHAIAHRPSTQKLHEQRVPRLGRASRSPRDLSLLMVRVDRHCANRTAAMCWDDELAGVRYPMAGIKAASPAEHLSDQIPSFPARTRRLASAGQEGMNVGPTAPYVRRAFYVCRAFGMVVVADVRATASSSSHVCGHVPTLAVPDSPARAQRDRDEPESANMREARTYHAGGVSASVHG